MAAAAFLSGLMLSSVYAQENTSPPKQSGDEKQVNGKQEAARPNIDRLAREGMVFSNSCTASPECAASRAGLMTGLHMGHSPVRRNRTDVRPEKHPRPYLTDRETSRRG